MRGWSSTVLFLFVKAPLSITRLRLGDVNTRPMSTHTHECSVCSSTLSNGHRVETAQDCVSESWRNKMGYLDIRKYHLAIIKYQCMKKLHELWKTMPSVIIQPEQDILCDFIYTEWPQEAEKNWWLSRLGEPEGNRERLRRRKWGKWVKRFTPVFVCLRQSFTVYSCMACYLPSSPG